MDRRVHLLADVTAPRIVNLSTLPRAVRFAIETWRDVLGNEAARREAVGRREDRLTPKDADAGGLEHTIVAVGFLLAPAPRQRLGHRAASASIRVDGGGSRLAEAAVLVLGEEREHRAVGRYKLEGFRRSAQTLVQRCVRERRRSCGRHARKRIARPLRCSVTPSPNTPVVSGISRTDTDLQLAAATGSMAPSARFLSRTTKTGHGAWRMTRSAMLPMSRWVMPVLPCVPMTMRSAPVVLACSMMT